MTDHDLDGFITATRRHLDAELAASTATPDLAAAVARAREIDPDTVPAAAVREVAELPPITQLRPRTRDNLSDKTALASFTDALRDHLDTDLARQIHRTAIANNPTATSLDATTTTTAASHATSTVVPFPAPRSRRPLVALAVTLAAAVLLTLGLRSALEARQAHQGAIPGAAALASLRTAASQAELRDPPRRAVDRPVPEDIQPVPEDIQPVPEDSIETPDPKASTSADTSPPEPRPRPRKPPPASTPEPTEPTINAPPAEDPLTALDREAQARWRSGDLRGAADKFTEIVQRAPGSRAAETAYGDLFALEHQLGGEPVALWRAYLRQFPRGRYADDARAGVCHREPTDTRAQCWTDYLAAHPDGAHRREAEAAAP